MKDAGNTENSQEKRVARHYAMLASRYDRKWDRYTRVSLGTMFDHLTLRGNEKILDCACGTGRFAAMIREKYPNTRIAGTDLSPEMLEVARSRLPEDGATRWHVASTEELPFKDATFDIVTCANAYHLLPGPEKAMREMVRVTKPGGTVCIVDWCREYPQIAMLLGFSRIFGKQYRQILTRDELRAIMERGGLKVTHTTRFKATWFWGLMCLLGRRAGK
jgi:ubiquinone/menaquinone biosynthesis C-methylase UbiE